MSYKDDIRLSGSNKKKLGLDLKNIDKTELRAFGYHDYNKDNIFSPICENKKGISIIVTAYNADNYIEECLDSIEKQTYFINNDNYEIIIGIDCCKKTLDKVLEIRNKYRNIKVIYNKKNVGTYITTNTLLSLCKYENIIRFDSDDVMKPEMVNEIMYNLNDNNFIRFRYTQWIYDKNEYKDCRLYAHGVVFYTKNFIDLIGGYQSWRCAADTELINRSETIKKELLIDKSLFFRRMHSDSLTRNKEYGMNSEIRKEYYKNIGISKIKINPELTDYYEY